MSSMYQQLDTLSLLHQKPEEIRLLAQSISMTISLVPDLDRPILHADARNPDDDRIFVHQQHFYKLAAAFQELSSAMIEML